MIFHKSIYRIAIWKLPEAYFLHLKIVCCRMKSHHSEWIRYYPRRVRREINRIYRKLIGFVGTNIDSRCHHSACALSDFTFLLGGYGGFRSLQFIFFGVRHAIFKFLFTFLKKFKFTSPYNLASGLYVDLGFVIWRTVAVNRNTLKCSINVMFLILVSYENLMNGGTQKVCGGDRFWNPYLNMGFKIVQLMPIPKLVRIPYISKHLLHSKTEICKNQ